MPYPRISWFGYHMQFIALKSIKYIFIKMIKTAHCLEVQAKKALKAHLYSSLLSISLFSVDLVMFTR